MSKLTSHKPATVSELLTAIFETLDRESLPYVVMRNYEGYPESLTGDVDLSLRAEDMPAARDALIDCARSVGWDIFFEVKRPYVAYLGMCSSQYPERSVLVVELFCGGTLHWNAFLPAEDLIGGRQRLRGFWIPSPNHETVLTLVHHLMWGSKVPPKYRELVHSRVSADPLGVTSVLAKKFGPSLARELVRSVVAQDWERVIGMAKPMRQRLISKTFTSNPAKWMPKAILTIRALRNREPGISLIIQAPSKELGAPLLKGMFELADEWHLFNPCFRKSYSCDTLDEAEAQLRNQKNCQGVAAGGLLLIGLFDDCQTKDSQLVLRVDRECFRLGARSVTHAGSQELGDHASAHLAWELVLTTCAELRNSTQK